MDHETDLPSASFAIQAQNSGALKGYRFVLVMIVLTFFGMVNLSKQVTCSQQKRQSQDEQGYLSQNLYGDGSNGRELAMIADGGISSPQEQQLLVGDYYRTNKRATRKMSSFMPMRGRKDGRDEPESMGSELANFSELDDSEPSILRLVSASQRSANNQGQTSPSVAAAGRLLHWSNPNHSLLSRHLSGLEQTPTPVASALNQRAAPTDNMEGQFMEQPVMQAKLRRAFHPMRGKKSWASPEIMLAPEFADSDSFGLMFTQELGSNEII